jgi:hypothetical protein
MSGFQRAGAQQMKHLLSLFKKGGIIFKKYQSKTPFHVVGRLSEDGHAALRWYFDQLSSNIY